MPDRKPLPAPLLNSLHGVPGYDESAFIQAHTEPSPTAIRLNPAKLSAEEIPYPATPVPWCATGLYLNERPSFILDPLIHAGGYYVQEAGSQFLWQILEQLKLSTQSRVLDLCGAPGGKSTLLAGWFTQGLVVANEIIKPRNAVLVENLTKWGGLNKVVTSNDPVHFQRLPSFFDLMVIDAPCSGSGLMRREPEAIDEWSESNVQICQQRQQRILADAWPALAPGGYLVYSTCSYSPAENEWMVDWLMKTFEVEPVQLTLNADWQIVETRSGDTQGYGYRFFPHLTRTEGFFCAVFRKKGAGGSVVTGQDRLPAFSKTEEALAHEWIGTSTLDEPFFWKQGDQYLLIERRHAAAIQQLQQHLYLRMAGLALGEPKNKGWVPDHALAVSGLAAPACYSVAVSEEQALAYLRKQDNLVLDGPKGWLLLRYRGLGLGWAKHLGNRINNYYPASWRILKT